MNNTRLNPIQLVVALVSIALMIFLPFVRCAFGIIPICNITLFDMCQQINAVMWLVFLVLLVEVCISFVSNRMISLITGGVGLLIGIILAVCLTGIMEGGNISSILKTIQAALVLLPESIRSQIPSELNAENINTIKSVIVSLFSMSIGYWIYMAAQLVFIVCGLLSGLVNTGRGQSSGGSSDRTRTGRPRTTRVRTY